MIQCVREAGDRSLDLRFVDASETEDDACCYFSIDEKVADRLRADRVTRDK